MSSLLVKHGLHAGQRFILREKTRIGRALENEIALADHLVSRFHAEITRQEMRFVLRDLGSKNGLRVNGDEVSEKDLHFGDTVEIGQTTFVFEPPHESKAARFSDRTVHLISQPDHAAQIFSPASLPAPTKSDATGFLLRLGRLFDCENEELPETLNTVLRQLMELFNAQAGSILLRNSSGEATPLVVAAEDREIQLGQEMIHLVLNEAKAILTASLPAPNEESHPRPRKAMIIPLLRREQVFGAVHLERPAGKEYTGEDLGFLQALAPLLAGAVHHAIQLDQLALAALAPPALPYLGTSNTAQSIREQIRRVSASDSTILLTGETGTGKELVAHAIHAASPRAARPFVAIDCSSIPASLIESELFGHEPGAFTGADRLKRGKVEMAEGGTLFLDEIGEMQIDLQPKLLRFIEELVFYRVGGVRPIHADVRIIAATNRNLKQATEEGRFRQDLWFRLNVMPFPLPPLREHPEDVRPLVDHFVPRLAPRIGKPFLGLTEEAWMLLERYRWPGNVRELRHGLERALILSDDGILRPEHFQLAIPESIPEHATDGSMTETIEHVTHPGKQRPRDMPSSMAAVEADAIRRALRYAGGNRLRAAQVLKIHRNTLAKKIQEYEIQI